MSFGFWVVFATKHRPVLSSTGCSRVNGGSDAYMLGYLWQWRKIKKNNKGRACRSIPDTSISGEICAMITCGTVLRVGFPCVTAWIFWSGSACLRRFSLLGHLNESWKWPHLHVDCMETKLVVGFEFCVLAQVHTIRIVLTMGLELSIHTWSDWLCGRILWTLCLYIWSPNCSIYALCLSDLVWARWVHVECDTWLNHHPCNLVKKLLLPAATWGNKRMFPIRETRVPKTNWLGWM